jgi:2-keto-4-pentenoate hydratase
VNRDQSAADRLEVGAAGRLAADLADARRGRFAIASRRGTSDSVSLDAAYQLAGDLERERILGGWRPVGWKLGFTNQALWSRLGLDRPIRARIYEQTVCTGAIDSADLVQPRIEPEIVVGFGADVPRNSSTHTIAAAIEWVAAGLEVVRCHFADWEMTPAEAVADAGVHAALAFGRPAPLDSEAARALAGASGELLRDGMLVATGRGADVLGGPLDALRWLLRELPGGLRAGEIVTTGTLTPAMAVEPGQRWEHRLSARTTLEPVVLSFS